MESVLAVASFQVYGMVTVQVTVLPDPRATATAADSEMKFPLPMSSTLASTSHPIFAVAAIVESTVMVNVVTILPEKLVKAGASASSCMAGCGMVWKTPVCGSRYPRIPCAAAALWPQSDTFNPREQATTKNKIDSL